MSRLVWDEIGKKEFETGVNQCALFPWDNDKNDYAEGVAWNGISSVQESPSGAEASAIYADNIKYLNLYSAEELGATVEAYMYPDEFAECDGSAEIAPGIMIGQQSRKSFALAYKTLVGNDTLGNDFGYKLHVIYGCKASPSEKQYQTVNDSPEAISFSWTMTTTPVNVDGFKPTANVVIDSTVVSKDKMALLEAIIYGADEFKETKTYRTGDVVEKDGDLYVANSNVSVAGPFDPSNWDKKAKSGSRVPMPNEIVELVGIAG